MRLLRIFLLVALGSWVMVGAVLTPAAGAGQRSTITGQWQCDDRGVVTPLAGMTVELWKRGTDWLPVELVGSRIDQQFTRADGTFRMTTPADDDVYFVRQALRDAHGVHLRDFWGINDWSIDSVGFRNDAPSRNIGGLLLSTPGQSHKCAIWAGVHGANEAFRADVGTDLPGRGVEIQADAVTAGTPFTPGTSILWPGGYPVGYAGGGDDSVTRHEYGHVIRHGYDGDFGHFLGDVVTFNYAQNHTPCLHSNGGYAFNEGWAEFWARDFEGAPDCGRPGDMETEGNVAAALTELMENCAGGSRRLMVEVLQRNPGTIHSFSEFRDRLGCPVPPPVPPPPIKADLSKAVAPPVDDALRAALAAKEARATVKVIAGLQKKLKAAEGRAAHAPPCKSDPCLPTLKALTIPPGLQLELSLARIHLRSVDDFDTQAEQSKLRQTSLADLTKGQSKRAASDRRKAVRAALLAAGGVLKAARPVFQADSSGFTKKFHVEVAKAASRFRKASKKASKVLPDSLVFPPAAFKLPPKVPEIPAPPTPTPIPFPTVAPVPSNLAFVACPDKTASPKPIEVSGTLTPAQADSEVKVSFTFGKSSPVVVIVRTDANGDWKASHQPGPNDFGTWSIDASFAGDVKRKASSASTCQTFNG